MKNVLKFLNQIFAFNKAKLIFIKFVKKSSENRFASDKKINRAKNKTAKREEEEFLPRIKH